MKSFYRILGLICCYFCIGMSQVAIASSFDEAVNAYDRKDYYSAKQQFTALAENNDPHAQFMLGKMFATGEGTAKDYILAYKWLHLADLSGVEEAGDLKRMVSRRMPRHKIAKAQQLADQWHRANRPVEQSPEILERNVVFDVQEGLKKRGYYFGKVDGIVGRRTRNAVAAYQNANRIGADGRITAELLQFMGISQFVEQGPIIPSSPLETEYTSDTDLHIFQKKLRKIIKRAKRKNAADPWLIKKLEELATGNLDEYPHLVLTENFMDANYQGGEEWRVTDGNFHLESGTGLIGTTGNSWGKTSDMNELALDLMGLLLEQERNSGITRDLAKVESDISFTNAFTFTLKTGPLRSTKGLILSCRTKSSTPVGYQLVFHPGQEQRAKLFRVAGNNATEITADLNPIQYDPNALQALKWTRAADGTMDFTVNGQRLLHTNVPTDPIQQFDSIGIAHIGEQVVLREIELKDAQE